MALNLFYLTYKGILGPLLRAFSGATHGCRFVPTCADYAREAFEVHSIPAATALTFRRVCRCHPWSTADMHDPVPPTPAFFRLAKGFRA